MLNGAGLQDEIRHGIRTEFAVTATSHSKILVAKDSMMPPYELCFGKKGHCVWLLEKWEWSQPKIRFK